MAVFTPLLTKILLGNSVCLTEPSRTKCHCSQSLYSNTEQAVCCVSMCCVPVGAERLTCLGGLIPVVAEFTFLGPVNMAT